MQAYALVLDDTLDDTYNHHIMLMMKSWEFEGFYKLVLEDASDGAIGLYLFEELLNSSKGS